MQMVKDIFPLPLGLSIDRGWKLKLTKKEFAILRRAIDICEKATELTREYYYNNDSDYDHEIDFAMAEMHLREALDYNYDLLTGRL